MSSGVVTSVLQGGLGNVMFQIAAAIGYGLRHNKQISFYKELYRPSHHGPIENYFDNILKNVRFEELPTNPYFQHYIEKEFHHTEIPYVDDNLLLEGYFQTDKYFSLYRDQIEQFFSFDIENKKKEVLNHEETCSIHNRRGDYLHLQEYHAVQNLEYYEKSISQFDNHVVFIVISNDILWCKENFANPNFKSRKFIFVENNRPEEDFYIASHCNHNIIANSTFSWWSAWLNKNHNKKVIAPKNWFGPSYSDKNTKDIYVEEWVIV